MANEIQPFNYGEVDAGTAEKLSYEIVALATKSMEKAA